MYKADGKNGLAKTRKHTRFRADRMTTAKVQSEAQTSSFMPECGALVYEEAYGGCCLIMLLDRPIDQGEKWRIQVGSLQPMTAEIAWAKVLDEGIWKVGLKYLE